MQSEDQHGRNDVAGEGDYLELHAAERMDQAPQTSIRGFTGPDHSTIYSAPRRFDIATLLTVMGAYALLFTIMRLLRWQPAALGLVGGFFTAVGIGQALLFGGNSPRRASVLVGIAYWVCAVMALTGGNLCVALTSVFWGGISGYVAGTLVGGVFLVADAVRRPS